MDSENKVMWALMQARKGIIEVGMGMAILPGTTLML